MSESLTDEQIIEGLEGVLITLANHDCRASAEFIGSVIHSLHSRKQSEGLPTIADREPYFMALDHRATPDEYAAFDAGWKARGGTQQALRPIQVTEALKCGAFASRAIGSKGAGLNSMKRKDRDLTDVLRGRHRFPKRSVHECTPDGKVTKYAPWGMQIRMWLGLGCAKCGSRLWLFSCRYGYCERRATAHL